MTELPLNLSNKVDRRALPQPDWSNFQERPPYQAPRNEIEQALADVWTEILQVTSPGINDNFFDLGGDSLLASRLIVRVHEGLSAEIGLRDMFSSPTLVALAQRIEEVSKVPRRRALPEVVPARSRMDGSAAHRHGLPD
jgi:surfactin family lipopeptide synthetase A